MKRRNVPRHIGLLTAAAVLALSACGDASHETRAVSEAPPVTVSVIAPATELLWPETVEMTGTLTPLRRATPASVLLGTVEAIGRREGERVRAGDLLARIDSREAAARAAQAEAGVVAARADAENARVMVERLRRLHAKDAATKRSLDDAEAAWEAAEARVRAAEEAVKAASVTLDHARVTAPFAGVVSERRVEVGDTAAPGVPLFVIDDLSRVKVEVQVAESDLAGLGEGNEVRVAVPAVDEPDLVATVDEILPAGDAASRTFAVRALLDNPDGVFRAGMFARMTLVRGLRPMVAVPEPALLRRGPLVGVFVVDTGNVARLRWITTGESRGGQVEVLTGLGEGDRVVSPLPPDLEDGQPVEVR